MNERSTEQHLVDICFQVAYTIHTYPDFQKMNKEEVMSWVAKQLDGCGYKTKPIGLSWGVLIK